MATKIGTSAADVLDGTFLGDTLDGLGGNDVLNGEAGVDTLIGGTGADAVFGGLGRDFLIVGDGHSAASEIYDGGGGFNTDTLVLSQSAAPIFKGFQADFSASTIVGIEALDLATTVDVTVTFAGSQFGGSALADALSVLGGTGKQTIVINMKTDQSINLGGHVFADWSLSDDILINGDADAEIITGTSQGDVISSGLGGDIVSGGGGNDVVIINDTGLGDSYSGGSGVDYLKTTAAQVVLSGVALSGFEVLNLAGPGDQRVSLESSQIGGGLSSTGTINVVTGTSNTVAIGVVDNNFSASGFFFGGFDADDKMFLVGNAENNSITGSKVNDEMRGNGGADVLLGAAGNDTMDGGTGGDIMFGGSGDDFYIIDNAGDTAAEILIGTDPGGIDTVRSSVVHTLTGFIENLTLTGAATINGTGNGLANTVTGNGGDNVLRGLGGIDRLAGRGGADDLFGGSGNDQFIFLDIADSETGAARDQVFDFAVGVDRIRVSAIDANQSLDGNQAFVEDANGILVAGEFRLREVNGNTFIDFETDSGAGVDMQIAVVGTTGLTVLDLIL